MTKRTELQHRKAEAQAKLMTSMANRAFSKRTTGLDKVAKNMVAKKAGPSKPDRDLDHD